MERSFMLLKPDALERNLRDAIIDEIDQYGLQIVTLSRVVVDHWGVLSLYPKISTLVGWLRSREYIEGKVMEYIEVEGANAITDVLEIKQKLRKLYGNPNNTYHTLVHCPDTDEDYEAEKIVLLLMEVKGYGI